MLMPTVKEHQKITSAVHVLTWSTIYQASWYLSWHSVDYILSYFYSITKHKDNTKKNNNSHVVRTRLIRVGCFNWLAYYKLIRNVTKYMGAHCTVYILKGVFAKNERGYRLTAQNNRF